MVCLPEFLREALLKQFQEWKIKRPVTFVVVLLCFVSAAFSQDENSSELTSGCGKLHQSFRMAMATLSK